MRRPIFATTATMIVLALNPSVAFSEMCKYIDAEGNVSYSNVAPAPDKGWKKLSCAGAQDAMGKANWDLLLGSRVAQDDLLR